ncbi:hypothetical protein AFCA_002012 [Aspergillus flavus]|nr:uncharacterized protein G4B84_001841 [Aspergillus flavus NRRL3357]KAJ1711654.1 hypothetical protein NYO67_6167 [Aspergillus flavus]QMW26596.1 hypothetical protein G4B84_001841 [Aspergillus flavus NRRL3357]QMW38675.1 hypothetical protein G4B11_001911 [Aspergillus flavus]RMZ37733.1 hypothetical protein CA14_004854 [Aspergillus flavus]UCK59189.1 hypothetical protein AFCA_002012 [Aspergillus flavus]
MPSARTRPISQVTDEIVWDRMYTVLIEVTPPPKPAPIPDQTIAEEAKTGNLAPMMLCIAHKCAFLGCSQAARLTLSAPTRTCICLVKGGPPSDQRSRLSKELKALIDQDLHYKCTPIGPYRSSAQDSKLHVPAADGLRMTVAVR